MTSYSTPFATTSITIAPTMLSDTTSDIGRLTVLERFWSDVWGNECILKKQATRRSGSDSRTLEFLDFGRHVEAVELFCPATRGERLLLVVDEYREAMRNFQIEGNPPPFKRGACITGQPGIGKTCHAYPTLILPMNHREILLHRICRP